MATVSHGSLVAAIHERHIAEFDIAACAREGSPPHAACGRLSQQRKDALAGGDSLLQRAADIYQAAQGRRDEHQSREKSPEVVELHALGKDKADGDVQNAAE